MHPKRISLPRLGAVRVKEGTQKFQGRILSATACREADRWFVSLTVERDRLEPDPVVGTPVGVDLGPNPLTGARQPGCRDDVTGGPAPIRRRASVYWAKWGLSHWSRW